MKNNAISQYYKKKSGNNYTNISTDNELLSLSNGNIIQYTDGSEYLKVGNNVFDKTNNGYATSSDVSTNYSLKSNTVKSISSADANGNCTVTMDNGNTNSFKAGVSSNELNAVNNASISKIDDANTSTGICSCKNASGTQIDTFTCHVSKTNKNANLTYGAKTTIATIDGTDITVTMPTALDTKSVVSNKNATLNWGTSTTIATVDNQNISVKLPNNPNTDTTYSAGTGLSLSGNSFNVNIPNYKVSDGSNPDETYIMTLDVNQGACHPSQYTIGNLVDKINNSGKTYSAGTGLFLSGTEFNVDIPNYKVSDGFNPDGAYIMTLDVNQGACHPSQYTIEKLVDKINNTGSNIGEFVPLMDWDAMATACETSVYDLKNIRWYNHNVYGGDRGGTKPDGTSFARGDILLKPLCVRNTGEAGTKWKYDELWIYNTNDNGYDVNVRKWSMKEFAFAIETFAQIELIQGDDRWWTIHGTKDHGFRPDRLSNIKHLTQPYLNCDEQNCGIIEIFGVNYTSDSGLTPTEISTIISNEMAYVPKTGNVLTVYSKSLLTVGETVSGSNLYSKISESSFEYYLSDTNIMSGSYEVKKCTTYTCSYPYKSEYTIYEVRVTTV